MRTVQTNRQLAALMIGSEPKKSPTDLGPRRGYYQHSGLVEIPADGRIHRPMLDSEYASVSTRMTAAVTDCARTCSI